MSAPYYQDDAVTLYHGDCLVIDEWLAADVLVTDPPYGVNAGSSVFSGDRHGNAPTIAGEDRTGRAADRVLTDWHVRFRDGAIASWGSRPALVFGSWRAPRPKGTLMRLIWDKRDVGQGGVGSWRATDEEIYVLAWPNAKDTSKPDGSVIRWPNPATMNRDHPTPKPVGLMERLVSACPPGTIADPFAGSGSTLVAARNLGRKAIGVELEERYCEVIAKRLAQDVLDFGTGA